MKPLQTATALQHLFVPVPALSAIAILFTLVSLVVRVPHQTGEVVAQLRTSLRHVVWKLRKLIVVVTGLFGFNLVVDVELGVELDVEPLDEALPFLRRRRKVEVVVGGLGLLLYLHLRLALGVTQATQFVKRAPSFGAVAEPESLLD